MEDSLSDDRLLFREHREFPQTLQRAMDSSIESTSAAKNADEESRRRSMGDIVLNTPKPPALWHEISVSIKEEVFPRSSEPFSLLTWILSAAQGLFPVLQWGRSYSFKYFRSDFMAGLTLASLGIPQVIYFYFKCSLSKISLSSCSNNVLKTIW